MHSIQTLFVKLIICSYRGIHLYIVFIFIIRVLSWVLFVIVRILDSGNRATIISRQLIFQSIFIYVEGWAPASSRQRVRVLGVKVALEGIAG